MPEKIPFSLPAFSNGREPEDRSNREYFTPCKVHVRIEGQGVVRRSNPQWKKPDITVAPDHIVSAARVYFAENPSATLEEFTSNEISVTEFCDALEQTGEHLGLQRENGALDRDVAYLASNGLLEFSGLIFRFG